MVDNYVKIVDERGRNLMCDRTLPSLLVNIEYRKDLVNPCRYGGIKSSVEGQQRYDFIVSSPSPTAIFIFFAFSEIVPRGTKSCNKTQRTVDKNRRCNKQWGEEKKTK